MAVTTLAAFGLAIVANEASWSPTTTYIVGLALLVVVIGVGTPLVFLWSRPDEDRRQPRRGRLDARR